MYPHLVALFTLLVIPALSWAASGSSEIANLTGSVMGIISLVLFVVCYVLVMFEEQLHLRKSKPVMVAAGIIWILVALSYQALGKPDHAHAAVMHNLSEYVELFLFLLAAMTYINAMEERNTFLALRSWMVTKGFTLRQIFWMTGLLAFFISPVADNLTTALLMGAVVMAVGANNPAFMVVSCINIVVAANAGGAFSPFGDITTLMIWQKGKVDFFSFFALFVPSLINWLVPAVCMSLTCAERQAAGH
jgi:Na+/H+ antiporter NhaD/arsenite permease-like protein